MNTRNLAALLCIVGFATSATAQTLSAISPRGGQRGTEVVVNAFGRSIGDPLTLLFKREGLELLKLEPRDDRRLTAKIKIAEDCPLGAHPVWLVTKRGLSRLVMFHVGTLPEVAEKEPNDSRSQAQEITGDVTINGRITAGETDFFKLELEAGDRFCAEVQGIRLDIDWDPCLHVYDAGGKLLARSEDTALGRLDPIVHVETEAAGPCFIAIRDSGWGGSGGALYRLHVGDFPRPVGLMPCVGAPGAEVEAAWLGPDADGKKSTITFPKQGGRQPVFIEHEGSTSPTPVFVRVRGGKAAVEGEAVELTPPFAVQGIIAKPGELDRWTFQAKKGQNLAVQAVARRLRSPLDPVVIVRKKSGGGAIGSSDDTGHPDGRAQFRIPEDGEYVLFVRDHLRRGGADFFYAVDVDLRRSSLRTYQQVAGQRPEDFGVVVPRGGRAATMIRATGLDRNAGIRLGMANLPAGVEAVVPEFAPGTDLVPVLFRAKPDAVNAATLATFDATAEKDPKERSAGFLHVVPRLRVFNNAPYEYELIDRMPVALADPVPFRIEVEAPKVPIIRGSPMQIPVKLHREEGFKGGVRVRMLWNPPGIGAGQPTIPAGKDATQIALNANGNAATSTWPCIVIAYASVAGVTRVVSSELFELTVSEPWITAKLGRVRVDQGKSIPFGVELEPKRDFDGEFQVELHGLPRGITTEFPKADRDAKTVTLDIKVDAKAPRGRHRSPYVRIRIPTEGGDVWHHFGGGEIRVDRPLPPRPKKTAAPASAASGDAKKPGTVKKPKT